MAYQPKSYRKFVATAATATLVATAVTPAFAAENLPFGDVNKNYAEAVGALYSKNIVKGVSKTEFGTYKPLKRGDAAVIIAKALELDTKNAPDAGFKDVNSKIKGAVNALVAKGIISGVSKDKFDPNSPLTRGQMAKILVNAYPTLKDEAKETPFKDLTADFKPYIEALYGAGITGGTSDTTYGTTQKITRGDFAKLLYKAMNYKKVDSIKAIDDITVDEGTKLEDVKLPEKVTVVYTDKSEKEASVKWDTSKLDTSKPGTYKVEGTVDGTDLKASVNVVVKAAAPKVVSVKAINSTQAVVTFSNEVGQADATNFTVDNGLAVVKAEVNENNKKEVTLTFNQSLDDKTTYKVTANGVKSVSGAELKEDSSAEFTYEVGEVSNIQLTKTKFVGGDKIADFVKVTNANGVDVTDKYTVEISSTSQNIADKEGKVSPVTSNETAYVQVKVKSGDQVVKESDAIKVTLAPSAVSSLVGFGLVQPSDDVDTVTAYKKAVKDGKLTTEMKKSDTPNLKLLVNNNGTEQVLSAKDVTKIENLTPAVATVSKEGDELVVHAYSTGTAQVKLTIGDFVTTVSFTVNADSKIANATLDKSNVYFNTADNNSAQDTVNVKLADQYGKDFNATVDSDGNVKVGDTTVGTLTAKSSNTNVATVAVGAVGDSPSSDSPSSTIPVTVTKAGKGTATVTVEFKDTKGNVVFTKTFTVTGKDAGAFAGYVIETDSNAIDLDKDNPPEKNDNTVHFSVYEVDAQGNKIKPANNVTLEIQGYDKKPEVSKYIGVVDQTVTVTDEDAYKKFAGSGTLNVDVKVNNTKIGTKTISYQNTDPVATKAAIDTVNVIIDNDKIDGKSDSPLILKDLFYGHYDATTGKYTIAPKLSVLDQSSKVIDWDTTTQGKLSNSDSINDINFTITNDSDVDINGSGLDTTVSLASGKTTGSFTVVVSDVDTQAVNDILPAPVAFKVTIVD
ncbi:S-layer homology domain-containing protein [Bacillus smithii]|uniref:S-layer homology domain-containing protein n=1 Tax=Bacillus smithii TaxID=1479 RepID=UPI00077BF207|nr:S-layer homology domain-containing protein [Bacillus smithii]